MKLQPEEMVLFPINYGDLIRPPFRILPNRGWGQCTNSTRELLIVYGPKHQCERSVFDTSPYVLPPGRTTPDNWDCDGFFLPSDRKLKLLKRFESGPVAVKFWNFRRFSVRQRPDGTYECSWHNGVFEPSQINWAIPNFTYSQVAERLADAR